jgi:nucleoside-diphosphate-sugar epimerase
MSGNRVLVTGHLGYIGSVMVPMLVEAGYDVVGLDSGLFAECTLVPDGAIVPELHRDLRDLRPGDLDGFDAVIHLGALSNDPIGNLDERWTRDINDLASVRLAELARDAGVERFLFSSSCIMYGMSEVAEVDETSPLAPQTEYARSKARSEEAIRALASDAFSPVFLRNGTIYGMSPRMRFDTVLNNLVASAATTGRVVVQGDGSPWRPVVHVEDVVRAFVHVLEAPREAIHAEAFNTGANHLNHRVIDLARIAASVVPGAELEVRSEPSADRRTYRADFGKFARTFPDFEFLWNAESGARNLADTFAHIGLTRDDFDGPRYVRLRWLTLLLESGRLDESLRWAREATG